MNIVGGDISSFLGEKAQYQIPIYQRKYQWEKSHCERLLDDIIAVANDEKRKKHFIGSIIYMSIDEAQNVSGLKKYYVIDGQQRLTTLSIFLVALGRYVEEYLSDEELKKSKITLDALKEDYLVNKRFKEDGDDYYKVRLTDEDFDVYKSLINDQSLPEDIEYSQVFENYKTFLNCMKKSNVNPSIIFAGFNKLAIGDVSLVPDDNAQLVFETVNSTGLELSVPDKIRNFVLMGATPEMQKKIYNTYWHPMELLFGLDKQGVKEFENFFYYYVGILTKAKMESDYYDVFKRYFLSIENSEVENEIAKIKRFAKHYKKWLDSDIKSEEIEKIFFNIKQTGQWKVTPVVLLIYDNYTTGILSKDDASSMLEYIESYIIRRKLCGIAANSSGDAYVTFLKNVESKESFINGFKYLTEAQRFPTDEELFRVLRTANIYQDYKGNVRTLLERMEMSLNKDYSHNELHTIEHIMPQTVESHDDLYARTDISDEEKENRDWATDLGKEWKRIHDTYVHTIGNLSLTGYNTEYKNYRFIIKRDAEKEESGKRYGYKYSSINLSSSLAKLEQWGETEIIERAKEMTEIIIKIWGYPEIQQ